MKVMLFAFACLLLGSQLGCQKKAPPVTQTITASATAMRA